MSTQPQVYLLCEVAGVVAAVIVTMQQQARSRGSSAPDVLQVSLSVGFWMRVNRVGKPGRYQICTTLHEALYDTTAKHTCLCMCDTQKSIPTLTCSHSPPSRPLGYPHRLKGARTSCSSGLTAPASRKFKTSCDGDAVGKRSDCR